MRLVFTLILVMILGVGTLYVQTQGFTLVTAEAARRNSVVVKPRQIPDALLETAGRRTESLLTMLGSDGRVAIVNFMYAQCVSICLAMGSGLQQLQALIISGKLQDRVRLISISFDPDDTSQRLVGYGKQMKAMPEVWQFFVPVETAQRQALLDAFGITVVPASLGQFEHNAAFHVVTPQGKLARIVDLDAQHEALAYALALSAPDVERAQAGGSTKSSHITPTDIVRVP